MSASRAGTLALFLFHFEISVSFFRTCVKSERATASNQDEFDKKSASVAQYQYGVDQCRPVSLEPSGAPASKHPTPALPNQRTIVANKAIFARANQCHTRCKPYGCSRIRIRATFSH